MARLVPVLLTSLLLAVAAGAGAEGIPRQPSPEGAEVYFVSPHDGEVVKGPVTVRFGLRGMGGAPAGTEKAATGHHHLIIDAPLPDPGLPIPADAKHIHFGGGQTETTLELPPGDHTLQLVLGDAGHVPHDPPVFSERITIHVE